jgi:hypothetical protein
VSVPLLITSRIWDLALASSQDSALDPSMVDACREVIAAQTDLLRASGAFGCEN